MTTAFRPAYLPLSTSTTLPDFIIFPILTGYCNFSVNNNILLELAQHLASSTPRTPDAAGCEDAQRVVVRMPQRRRP